MEVPGDLLGRYQTRGKQQRNLANPAQEQLMKSPSPKP